MFCVIYRGAVDENNEQFVAYFLPTEETLTKRKRDSEEGVDYNAEDEYVHTDRTHHWKWSHNSKDNNMTL